MTQRTGGRILVDTLVAQGCERIFTVPGESFLAVLDALHDTPEIDLVVCRQEGGVGYMACADGAMTQRPGIAFVTRGPGATNASIGVHVARQDSQPMILFIGDVDRGTRDREAFQEINFEAMFTPIAKWAARIDDARRIPEYVARAYSVAMSGRPGPVVLALPEDMLLDQVEAIDRPRIAVPAQPCDPIAMGALAALLDRAERPVAIVGGAGWTADAGRDFGSWAQRTGIPVVAAFRRQDAVANDCPVYAGNLGYGPNPRLAERVKAADLLLVVGPRLGEATTDGYTLITPEHPGQQLVHVHPDPSELGMTYRTDLSICADMTEFAADVHAIDREPLAAGAEAHADYVAWSTPAARDGVTLDLGPCVATMRDTLPADAIICNGAGNYSGWWHRYWRYAAQPSQLAPTAGAMGYGVPAATAAALALAGADGGRARRRRVFPDERTGTRNRGRARREHAGAGHRQWRLRDDPHASGARVSGTGIGDEAGQPGFRCAGARLWLLGGMHRAHRAVRTRARRGDGARRRPVAPPENGYRRHHAGNDDRQARPASKRVRRFKA